MTFDERVRALAPLGLPPRQTAFIVTVALHGGYCVRRQFDAFLAGGASEGHSGQLNRNLFDSLVKRGLANSIQYQPNHGRVYHLHHKALYRSIEQVDNRNRRAVSPALIARKLMVLDYVLTAPPHEWLATEEDKVAWFTTNLRIQLADLPQRRYPALRRPGESTTRYFIHKCPIRIVPGMGAVHFVHLVEDETGRHLQQFLDDHIRLLSRVPTWSLVLVCPPHLRRGIEICRKVFADMFHATAVLGASAQDLAWYFRTRQAVDAGDLGALSIADLDTFRDLRRGLATPQVERLYADWQRLGQAALRGTAPLVGAPQGQPTLLVHELPWRYHQFGSLPGVA